MDEYVDEQMDEWMDGWVDEWMDGMMYMYLQNKVDKACSSIDKEIQ